MKIMQLKNSVILLILAVMGVVSTSCNDNKSYAEYMEDERKAVNAFLADQRVINEIPKDSVFETGEDAPFYKMTPDGDVFMQVISEGDRINNKAKENQEIYFRFMRASILNWASNPKLYYEGNSEDMSFVPMSFRYNNFNLESTSQFGYGIHIPLGYLGIDCEVKLLIRSQYGLTNEISKVTPYVYKLRYFPSKI